MDGEYCCFCNNNNDLFKIKTEPGEVKIKNDIVYFDSVGLESYEIILCSSCLYQFDMACVSYDILDVSK